MPLTRASRAGTPGTPWRMPSVSPAFSFVARNLPARTPPLKLFVATTDVLPFHDGMSLSISTTLTPCFLGLVERRHHRCAGRRDRNALHTLGDHVLDRRDLAGIVGAALALARRSPSRPAVRLSHFLAAFSRTKKKSTGNLVMNPSLTVACCLLGFAVAPVASRAAATSAARRATAPASDFFAHRASFREAHRIDIRHVPFCTWVTASLPCSSGEAVSRPGSLTPRAEP